MLQKTQGIVLHSLKYKDTSIIVDIYTEVSGRASFLVPVSRSRKAAVKSVLFQPLSLVELEADFRPNTSIYKVKEAKSFYPFTSIPYDPYKSAIALFLSEFLYRALREEAENRPLFAYLQHSIVWLDECGSGFANFHLVFLMRLSRFLGLYPNLEDYHGGDYFDLQNACFTPLRPQLHSDYSAGRGGTSHKADAHELRNDASLCHEPHGACPLSDDYERVLPFASAGFSRAKVFGSLERVV